MLGVQYSVYRTFMPTITQGLAKNMTSLLTQANHSNPIENTTVDLD